MRCLRHAAAGLAALLIGLGACGEPSNIWITTYSLPQGRVRLAYDVLLEASDAEGEVVWSIQEGALPPGLDLDPAGAIFGEPLSPGVYPFVVMAEDDAGEDLAIMEIDVPPVVLMSGFGPFEGVGVNPSIEALRPLHEQIVAELDVRVIELPVLWDIAWSQLLEEIERLDPLAIVATGVASGDTMRFEQTAVNEQQGEDNDGVTRTGEPVVEGGPATLATGLPAFEMAAAMEEWNYPTSLSDDAGTYLCNDIFYNLMHYAELEAPAPVVAGFIHVTTGYTVGDITHAHMIGLDALQEWMSSGRSARAVVADTHEAPVYFPLSAE